MGIDYDYLNNIFTGIIAFFVFAFIVGAIIGFIMGKVKSKKQKNVNRI